MLKNAGGVDGSRRGVSCYMGIKVAVSRYSSVNMASATKVGDPVVRRLPMQNLRARVNANEESASC